MLHTSGGRPRDVLETMLCVTAPQQTILLHESGRRIIRHASNVRLPEIRKRLVVNRESHYPRAGLICGVGYSVSLVAPGVNTWTEVRSLGSRREWMAASTEPSGIIRALNGIEIGRSRA